MVRQEGDGPIEVDDYDKAFEFSAESVSVLTLRDLYHRLAELQDDPHACIVRGAIAEGANPERMRRLAMGRSDAAPTLTDAEREVGLFDLDSEMTEEEARRIQLVADPDGAVDFALSLCPPAFRSCDLVWSFGASAGIKPRKLSLHFATFLDRPVLGSELKAIVEKWNADAGRMLFDPSIYGPQSIVYTARPVFEGDAIDPLEGCRIGLRNGTGRPLSLPRLDAPAGAQSVSAAPEAPEGVVLALVSELCGRAWGEMLAGKRTRQEICGDVYTQLRDCGAPPEVADGASRALCKAGNDPDVLRVHGGRRKPLSWFRDYQRSIYGTSPREPRPDVAAAMDRQASGSLPDGARPRVPTIDFREAFRRRRRALQTRVPTEIPTVDRATRGGLSGGEVTTFVGMPGSGKTTLAMQLALTRARKLALRAYVYGPDQGWAGIFHRLLADRGVGATLDELDDAAAEVAFAPIAEELERLVVLVDETAPGASLEAFVDLCRDAADVAAVVIDSAQTAVVAEDEGERQRIDRAMDEARRLADACLVPVLVVSQSNRASWAAKRREDRTNPLSSGRGSAGIEHRSQVVIQLEKASDGTFSAVMPKVALGEAGANFRLALDPTTWRLHEIDAAAAEEDEQRAEDERLRPYREAIVAELKKAAAGGEKRSGRAIEAAVPGAASMIRRALKSLVVAKEVFFAEGPRGALYYYLPTASQCVPPRPDRVPDAVAEPGSVDRVSASLPFREDAVAETRSACDSDTRKSAPRARRGREGRG